MTTILKVGFIGLGIMGHPMARNIADAGMDLVVWNRDVGKSASFAAAGILVAISPADLASKVDVICLCVSDAAAVEDILFGKAGIATATNLSAHLVLDFSTIGPDMTLSLADRLEKEAGVRWVDTPVSGGAPAAEKGSLILFAGGDAKDIANAKPVFDAVGQRTTHMGLLGSGQLTKLCNQLIAGINIAAIAEMMTFAKAAGIDVEKLPEALAGGFADSIPLQLFGPRMASKTFHPKLGELGLMNKDLGLALSKAQENNTALAILTAAADIYSQACALTDIGGEADITQLVTYYSKN